jgi:hypothetical protein
LWRLRFICSLSGYVVVLLHHFRLASKMLFL